MPRRRGERSQLTNGLSQTAAQAVEIDSIAAESQEALQLSGVSRRKAAQTEAQEERCLLAIVGTTQTTESLQQTA